MSLKVIVTEHVTRNMLTGALQRLSSLTSEFSDEKLGDMITAHLVPHRGMQFSANNDLGQCVTRILDQCLIAQIETPAALEQQFATLTQQDPLYTDTITQLAEGIASAISTPLYELRHVMPKKTQALVERITNELPAEHKEGGQPPLRRFSWGKLGDSMHRATAILTARNRLGVFKGDTVKYHDATNIMRALPHEQTKAVASAPEVRKMLVEAITAAAETAVVDPVERTRALNHLELAMDVLLEPRAHDRMFLSATADLNGPALASVVAPITDRIDAVEDLLQMINTATLSAINTETSAATDMVTNNLEVALRNIQLLRASMLYAKEHTLRDRLLFTPTVMHDNAFVAFEAEGGTEAMVRDVVVYLSLNQSMSIPANGMSAEMITAMYPNATTTVQKQAALLKSQAAAKKMHALQRTVTGTLEVDYLEGLRDGRYSRTQELQHQQAVQQAIATLTKKTLDDVATEYLVAMTNRPLTASLYKAINAELINLVQHNTEITPTDINEVSSSAVLTVLLDRVNTLFGLQKAA